MPLTREIRTALIEIVRGAARAEIMPRFRALDAREIDVKSHAHDLVTQADLRAEAQIRAALPALLPAARVIGEEGVAANPAELDALSAPGMTVIIDPVDGTWNFARGIACFGTLLAVVEHGETVFGLLYDPVMDDWIEAAKGEGTWHVAGGVRRQLKLGQQPALADLTGLHSDYGLTPAQWAAAAPVHQRFGRVTALRASIWDYRLMITGGAGFCLNRYLNVWDHAAGTLALIEAGGHSALMGGTPYTPTLQEGFLLCAASEDLWHEVALLFAPMMSA